MVYTFFISILLNQTQQGSERLCHCAYEQVFFFISYTIQYKEESMATCVELLAPRYRAAWVRNRRRAHSTADSCLSGTDSSPRCAAAPRMWPVCVWSALKLDQSNNYLLVRSDFFKMKTGIKITFVVRSLKSR